MNNINLLSLFNQWKFDYSKHKDIVCSIGDVCAIRYSKETGSYRRNYERAILLIAIAKTYNRCKVLEFGTGRGFVSGCLSLLPGISYIYTIDIVSSRKIKQKMTQAPLINIGKITFVTKNSRLLSSKDIPNDFDLVFIDGQHTYNTVKNDFEIALKHTVKDAIIVFDDYRNKYKKVKKYINSLDYEKIAVSTDGWLYDNKKIARNGDVDRLVQNRETESGQVILYKQEI